MEKRENSTPSVEEIKGLLERYRHDIANYHEGTGNMTKEDLEHTEREVESLKEHLAEIEGSI